jgi:hypothetical protein
MSEGVDVADACGECGRGNDAMGWTMELWPWVMMAAGGLMADGGRAACGGRVAGW